MKFITKGKYNKYFEDSQPRSVVRLQNNTKGMAKYTFGKEAGVDR